MFNWAKELLSPTVQTGKPVSGERRSSTKSNEEGELTEEGFVNVGRSSFFKSPEMPAPIQFGMPMPQSSNPLSGATQPSTIYPNLPYQPPTEMTGVGVDNSELVKRIPFRLRSGLTTTGGGGYRQQKPHEVYLQQFRSQANRYEYDFNFERGVMREFNQSSGCY